MSYTRISDSSTRPRLSLPVVLCALACLAVALTTSASAQSTAPPPPKPTHFVSDPDGVLDQATEDRLAGICRNARDRARIEIGVAVVHTTGGRDIFDYLLALARGWGSALRPGSRRAAPRRIPARA